MTLKEQFSKYVIKGKEGLKQHTVDSTAMLVVGTPAFALLETLLLNMPNENSEAARSLAAGMMYGGMGFIVAKGRGIYRNKMNIDDTE